MKTVNTITNKRKKKTKANTSPLLTGAAETAAAAAAAAHRGGSGGSGKASGGITLPDISASSLESAVTEQEKNKPTSGAGRWSGKLSAAVKKIADREPFSYDLDGDALYRRYKDEYLAAADRGMRDTVGEISAKSGGYGSSYAATAGSQAYGESAARIADIVPELYELALESYTAEGKELADRYSILADADESEYSRYRDETEDWYRDTERLWEQYESERDHEQDKAESDRDYSYQLSRDEIGDMQWLAEFEEEIRQYDASLAEKIREYNASLAEDKRQHDTSLAEDARQHSASLAQKSSSSASSSSSSQSASSASGSSKNGYSPSEQADIMEALDGYKQDYDIAVDKAGKERAIKRAIAYLSGLKYTDNNAYLFELVFGFVPEELGGNGSYLKDLYEL